MFEQPSYEEDGVIKDSRRIGIFFERGGLAQKYLRNMRWMDESTKKEYKNHLIYNRRRLDRVGYGNGGAQLLETYDDAGLIPQIENIFREVLIEETERELERKTDGMRDPLIKRQTLKNCRKCQNTVLAELDSKFREYYNFLLNEKVDAIPTTIFEYKV